MEITWNEGTSKRVKKTASTCLVFGFALFLGLALLALSGAPALSAPPCDEITSHHEMTSHEMASHGMASHEMASREMASHEMASQASCDPMSCCCGGVVASGLAPDFAVFGRLTRAPLRQPLALARPISHLTAPPAAPPKTVLL